MFEEVLEAAQRFALVAGRDRIGEVIERFIGPVREPAGHILGGNGASVDGKLIVQGAEDGAEGVRDGTGWTLAIDQGNGRLVATAASDAVAFVIFGACTPF